MLTMFMGGTSLRTIGLGILLGVVGTFLTYFHAPGLGLTLYSFLLIGTLFVFARIQHIRPVARNLFLVVPVLFFGIMFSIRSAEELTLLNMGAWIVAVLLLVNFFASGNAAYQPLVTYLLTPLTTGLNILVQPVTEFVQARNWLAEQRTRWSTLAPVVRGLVITVPVMGAFILMFSYADEVFARAVTRVVSAIVPRNLNGLPLQGIYAGLLAWTAIGGIAYALLDRKIKRAPIRPVAEADEAEVAANEKAKVTPRLLELGSTEVTMLLGGVCLVFAAFVAIQFVYLFGGVRNLTNFNYADYVRRGFAELVVIAIVTLGLIYFLNATMLRHTHWRNESFRILSTILIALTSVILMSAFQRLRLYETTYGFTTLRLTIYVFIVWLGVLFAGFTLSLFWTPATINVFGITLLLAGFGFVATLDILHPDAFVAQQNVNRGDIDPIYLARLSEEAIPVLATLVDTPEPGLRAVVRNRLAYFKLYLPFRQDDWREFNFDRSRAIEALKQVESKLTPYTRESEVYKQDLHELKSSLRQGMTTRQVTRQLGIPANGPSRAYGNYRLWIDNKPRDAILLAYDLGNDQTLELGFHTSDGLQYACVYERFREVECLSLLPAA
jgi:hypothetical protein